MYKLNIDIIDSSAESLPFPDNSFDLLLCMGVFMFTDQNIALKEFFRVLRPNGQLLLTANGLGYFIMKAKEGILFSQFREIKYGLTGLLYSFVKWNFGIQLGSCAVNTGEMSHKLKTQGFQLVTVSLYNMMELYPLEHFSFPTNYGFKAQKVQCP